ncbi:hypothetical protein RFY10_14490, partial [Acinetobacter baumannii]|nr:hypothetical protein [Acinetobacter baumannii]
TTYDTVFEALGISPELLQELETQGLVYEDSGRLHATYGGIGTLGPYAASILEMIEQGDALVVSFALSYDS